MSDNTVAVVLDRNFGSQLLELSKRIPVWIATSEVNRASVRIAWELHKEHSPNYDVTLITTGENSTEEELFLSMFASLNEHHPFWSVMEIYGVACLPLLAEIFKDFPASHIDATASGFIVRRRYP